MAILAVAPTPAEPCLGGCGEQTPPDRGGVPVCPSCAARIRAVYVSESFAHAAYLRGLHARGTLAEPSRVANAITAGLDYLTRVTEALRHRPGAERVLEPARAYLFGLAGPDGATS